MRKTSVYLPDRTKVALHEASARWNRSEAELIRLAVDRLLHGAEDGPERGTPPPADRLEGPLLVGVGVGPSAPDLVTRRAVEVMERADRVFAASIAPDAVGRAETIVRAAAPGVAVDRIAMATGADPRTRSAALDDVADTLIAALDRGHSVAFATLGDPNVYSVFPAIARRVKAKRPSVPVEIVPGVMAFQELAARTATVLSEPGERIELVTADEGATVVADALGCDDRTVIVYKGGRHLPIVADHLRSCGRLEGAVVGELLGLPGGRSGPVAQVADRPASYLATVIVPARRPRARSGEPTGAAPATLAPA